MKVPLPVMFSTQARGGERLKMGSRAAGDGSSMDHILAGLSNPGNVGAGGNK